MPWRRKGVCCLSSIAAATVALLASWAVAAEPADPSFESWSPTTGQWLVEGELYRQTEAIADCRSFAVAADWEDYTYEVKARKADGAEGFLILFRVADHERFYWWNIGGWGNSRHALETRPRTRAFPSVQGKIETGRWYDVKIVLRGPSIKCYLDGELIHEVEDSTYTAGGIGLGSWVTKVEYKEPLVTTPEGKKLFGADRIELVDRVLGQLGKAGEPFREEFLSLQSAGVASEDPRWGDLYQKVTRLRDRFRKSRKRIGQINVPAQRRATERLIGHFPAQKPRADELLAKLSGWETRLGEIEANLASFDPSAPTEAEALFGFFDELARFHRDLYARRSPPVAFLKREAGGRRGTNATMLARMTGVGSAICIYDPARPEEGPRTIFDDPQGFIFDMSPSYDGTKLVFAYKKEVDKREDSFHIYEINVDGTGLRQLTEGRFHDVSPVYLPDGRIVFNSTRVESFSLCQDFLSAALYVIDADGGNLRRLEYNTLCDTTPSVLDDGSILFTRWEYQDKNIFCTEGLWTLNPDGTRLQLFYGNTLTVPNAIYGAKQIPGTKKVLCVMAAHHFPPLGGIAIVDRSLGIENPSAMKTLTPDVPYRPTKGKDWRETSWGPGDIFYPWSYTDPWPLEEDLFLVSYGGPLEGGPGRYRLYLMDDDGFKVPLYEDPNTSCYNPVPLRPRPLPHPFPGQVPPEPKGEGRYFVRDVYQGLLQAGVKRGQVKRLRVMSQIPKKYNTEGPRYSDHYPAIGEGSYYVKYNYGTVPVYDDGSAYFVAPAGVELYFQALDADGKEIRRMGTITQITDGETQSCIGCHEHRSMAPPPSASASKRLGGSPDRITPPAWGAGPVDFVQQVQPVLDQYCVECHRGLAPQGNIDLSGDKTRLFNMAFEALVFTPDLVARYHINPGPTGNFPPLASGSYVSRLTRLIEEEHEGAKLDDLSRRKIYAWIDANVPYFGTWEMTRPHTFGGRDTWLDVEGKPLPWYEAFQKAYQAAGIPDDVAKVAHAEINLTHPEHSRVLLKYLAKSAGGQADDLAALFPNTDSEHYQALLQAIDQGKQALLLKPRMDMAGATPTPQQRDFGRTF